MTNRRTEMAEQIRSTDVLVKTALANPEIIQALKENPEGTLKRLGGGCGGVITTRAHPARSPHQQRHLDHHCPCLLGGDARVGLRACRWRGHQTRGGRHLCDPGGNGAHAVHARCRVSGWAAVAQSSDSDIERRGPTEAALSTKVGDITSGPWRQGGRFINAFNLNCLHF